MENMEVSEKGIAVVYDEWHRCERSQQSIIMRDHEWKGKSMIWKSWVLGQALSPTTYSSGRSLLLVKIKTALS